MPLHRPRGQYGFAMNRVTTPCTTVNSSYVIWFGVTLGVGAFVDHRLNNGAHV